MNNWEFDFTTSRGLNHIEWGTICEDSVKVCQKNGCILAALSDGVGSTESPEVASLTAVDETLGFLEEFSQDPLRLETLAKNTAFTDNNEYLFKQNLMQKIHAAMQDHPSSDATLVFLLAAPEYGVALTGWLGDSASYSSSVWEAVRSFIYPVSASRKPSSRAWYVVRPSLAVAWAAARLRWE